MLYSGLVNRHSGVVNRPCLRALLIHPNSWCRDHLPKMAYQGGQLGSL
jgi:hypothetical protein